MGVMEKSPLAARLEGQIEGELLFDAFSRGRYATDASIYQMTPLGAVVPKTLTDIETALGAARELGASVLPRGGGTSLAGQTVGGHTFDIGSPVFVVDSGTMDAAGSGAAATMMPDQRRTSASSVSPSSRR